MTTNTPAGGITASRRSVLLGLGAASVLGAAGSIGGAFRASPAQAADAAPVDITTAPFTVAAVRASSVQFDLVKSIAKAGVLIAAAAAKGAKLIVFGELWLPGYPIALNFDSTWTTTQLPAYAAQSITVGDRNWKALRLLADKFNVYVSIGYSERAGDSLYMGQALFGPDGTPLIVRRKVRPSGSERAIWSDDDMSQLKVVPTTIGRVGMLECWEHLHPQMTFNELAQKPSIHIAAWPYEPLWVSWRLLTLETRMGSCRESKQWGSRQHVGIHRRRRPPRSGWCGPCGRSWGPSTGRCSVSQRNSDTGSSPCGCGSSRRTSTTAMLWA